jgi:hypothetical protein
MLIVLAIVLANASSYALLTVDMTGGRSDCHVLPNYKSNCTFLGVDLGTFFLWSVVLPYLSILFGAPALLILMTVLIIHRVRWRARAIREGRWPARRQGS